MRTLIRSGPMLLILAGALVGCSQPPSSPPASEAVGPGEVVLYVQGMT
jgi:hypothetical protein